jgi:hypothetical protein
MVLMQFGRRGGETTPPQNRKRFYERAVKRKILPGRPPVDYLVLGS